MAALQSQFVGNAQAAFLRCMTCKHLVYCQKARVEAPDGGVTWLIVKGATQVLLVCLYSYRKPCSSHFFACQLSIIFER